MRYFGMDLVILNCGQMIRTTPELASLSPFYCTRPVRKCSTNDIRFNVHKVHIIDSSLNAMVPNQWYTKVILVMAENKSILEFLAVKFDVELRLFLKME
ncbi:hypothetical protein AVEN_138350-1 [Araneus ventricosus]|uniref:Uncharacterized protein n=1 Tax=Araneus ventricosus TaxID=182803 RepID=A0A4Y1ZSJ4_ARAVE|nr:hypothetical protein AVEN_138350-1 [Araneus ventricosus]